jgi:hypothetical protein
MATALSAPAGDGAASPVPLHVVVDSPELFRLNPQHPQVSS